MKRRVTILVAALGAVILLGAVAAGVVFAADPPTGATNYAEVMWGKVAKILGVDQKNLDDAFTQARNETIDQMVKDGRITADQAKFMKDRATQIQANGGPMGFGGPGGFGGPMHGGRFGGPSGGTSGTTPWGTPWGTPPWAATPTPTTH